MINNLKKIIVTGLLLVSTHLNAAPLVYEGTQGIGKGKHIVFLANDHEYRSEETNLVLAKILAKHHGFKCTVLFGIDENGHILPGAKDVPHLEVLKDADMFVFYARFMNLPEEQAQLIADYLERGGPIVGMRTSTHCFNGQEGKWSILNYDYKGEDYDGGLGKQVFGNTWDKVNGQSHYGENHRESGIYTPVDAAKSHPIMTGIDSFFAYNGAYKSQPPADATPLVEVQVLNTFEKSDNINTKKPKVNAGWTRDHYMAPSGDKKEARVFYTSIGASEDFLDEKSRRFVVNATLWCMGMEDKITDDLKVDIVGGFYPSAYFTSSLYREGVKPSDLAAFDSSIMPEDAPFHGVDKAKAAKVIKMRPKLLEMVQKLHPNVDLDKPVQKK